jgi:phage baseplate assembly protein W
MAIWARMTEHIATQVAELVPYHSEPVSPFGWGSDLDCADDLAFNMAELTKDNMLLVVQSCYRRLTTRRGTLDYDPDYGIDVLHLLNAGLTRTDLIRIQGQVVCELSKDDRLETVECRATFAEETLTLEITGMTRVGEFELTMGVTAAGAKLLSSEVGA